MDYSFLSKTELFNGMTVDEIKSISNCLYAHEKEYNNKDIIFRTGEYVKEIGLIESGSVNLVHYDYWGNKTILENIKTGDIFALSYATLYKTQMQTDVIANEDTKILFLNIESIISFCHRACPYHNRLIQNLFKISASNNLKIRQKVKHISSRTIREKLISFLSEQALLNNSPHFTINFNRQKLSEYLCVDRSALSNELSKMQKDGLLTYNKNTFTLKNLAYDS